MKKFEQYHIDNRSDEEYEKDFIKECHIGDLIIEFDFIKKRGLLFYQYESYYEELIFTYYKNNNMFRINKNLEVCSSFRYDLVKKILMNELNIVNNISIY